MIDLTGRICLVTGASRGVGKGIASQLAYFGATCYVTGRHLTTLEALRDEVKVGGSGTIIPVECDHESDEAVERLFQRINDENNGRLDVLVNNAFPAVKYIMKNASKTFWEQSPDAWDTVNNVGLRNQYRCAVHASRLMVEKRNGVIINISSPGGMRYGLSAPYGIGKAAQDRMAHDCAQELKRYKVAYVSLWPGVVQTEEMVELMNKGLLRGSKMGAYFERGETPTYVGKTVAAFLTEAPQEIMAKTGKIILVCDLGRAHGITDEHGVLPAHRFQVNILLKFYGYHRLSALVPDFVKIPLKLTWIMEMWNRC